MVCRPPSPKAVVGLHGGRGCWGRSGLGWGRGLGVQRDEHDEVAPAQGGSLPGLPVEAEGGEGTLGGGGLSTESLEAEGAWSEGSGGRGLGGQVATAGLPAERELPMSGTFVS